jgi:hypothetical protein
MATAHLTWTPATGLNQDIKYKKAIDASYTLHSNVPISTTTVDITGLLANTVYQFLVVNKCVYGFETATSVAQNALVTCPALSVSQTALALTVTFSDLGADVNEYVLEIYEMPSETFVATGTISSPTSSMSWTFESLTTNTYYKIKVIPKIGSTYQNTTCSVTERTLGCGTGYTLAPDASYCYQIEEVAATPPTGGTPENSVASTHSSYGTYGTYIYDAGFDADGTGTSNQISSSNPFWINTAGNSTDGPLNRSGLWATSELTDQDVGFSICLDLPETKVYYIGIAGDNRCRIVIDGVVWVDQDVSALATQYGADAQITFKVWHIYPVTLSAGPHIIELIGHNDSSDAALGAEIYNNTAAELSTATSYAALNLIFSTKDYRGEPIQLGSGGVGYTCPSGYSLAACEEPIVCRRILTSLPT